MTPTKLESDILIWVSKNSEDPLVALQAGSAKISNRDYTRTGFIVTLEIPDEIGRLPQDSSDIAPFSGPYIDSDDLAHGGDTVIFVESGAISRLEIFAYGDTFPERLVEYRLRNVELISPDISPSQPECE